MNKPLEQMRKEKNLTQKQLAKNVNISEITYHRYENKTRKPDVETAILIADALKIKSYKDFKALFGSAPPKE